MDDRYASGEYSRKDFQRAIRKDRERGGLPGRLGNLKRAYADFRKKPRRRRKRSL